jgi:DNA-binding NtrC family response regulator
VSHIRIILIGIGEAFRDAAHMAQSIGAQVTLVDSRDEALNILLKVGADLVIADVEADVPDLLASLRTQRVSVPVLACGIHARPEQAVAAIRAGAQDFLPLPPQHDLIAAAIVSAGKRTAEFVGQDPQLLRAVELGQTFARSLLPILVMGESGAGKETLARLIHGFSGRQGPFLTIECAGVPPEIIDSELFGHRAGAFLGAGADRTGRLLEASDGTVFIRNIDALPSFVQARLAYTMQQNCVEAGPEGAGTPLKARIIASSAADLEARVAASQFRADLNSRFSVVRTELPPLRERLGDVATLAQHFADNVALQNGLTAKTISDCALEIMQEYNWPGNIRELEQVVQRAVLIAASPEIEPKDLLLSNGVSLSPTSTIEADVNPQVDQLVGRTVADVERELILQTLERCQGNRTSASIILGISVRTMRNKLRSFIEAGIPVAPAL